MALEAGGSKVVRGNWHKHISLPLQTGRGQTQGGPGRLRGPSRDSFANDFPAPRSITMLLEANGKLCREKAGKSLAELQPEGRLPAGKEPSDRGFGTPRKCC